MTDLILIDNYDSFVHNLARYCRELGCSVAVVRNDAVSVEVVLARQPRAIIISPGPCSPKEAGISQGLVRAHMGIPILGVCLGHQAIAAAFGGRVVRADVPVHGQTADIEHAGTDLFAGIPSPLRVMRYHSLIVDESGLPPELRVTARTVDGIPMAMKHEDAAIFGVQFHPESVLTQHGHCLLRNFLCLAGLSPGPLPPAEHTALISRSLADQDFENTSSV